MMTSLPSWPGIRCLQPSQTPEGYTKLLHQLQATGSVPGQVLVVMEATGSYWISLATRLVHEGFGVSVINPAQAHHCAKALLKRAKTDAIDAQTLAQLAMGLQPEPWTPPPQIYSALQQRLAQRDDLLTLRQQVRNQLHALDQHPAGIAEVRARMVNLLATFAAQLNEVDGEIAATLRQDSAWAAAAARLQSITGIGWVTAAWTLVQVPIEKGLKTWHGDC